MYCLLYSGRPLTRAPSYIYCYNTLIFGHSGRCGLLIKCLIRLCYDAYSVLATCMHGLRGNEVCAYLYVTCI